jgi:hypothetical protein
VNQDVCLLSTILDEVESRGKGVSGVLGVAVVEVETEMFEIFRVGEMEVDAWTDCVYLVFFELLEVVCEVIPADPDFPKVPFGFENFLARVIITSEHEHINYKTILKNSSIPITH